MRKMILTTALISSISWAGFGDLLNQASQLMGQDNATHAVSSALSESEIGSALKEALAIGAEKAILSLSQPGGFLDNPKVKIPLPDSLQTVATALNAAGKGDIVKEFETAMNRAAEAAIPQTASIVKKAIQDMSIEDARQILSGRDNAATQYLMDVAWEPLMEAVLPIVSKTTEQTEATALFKQITSQYKEHIDLVSNFFAMGTPEVDLDNYITEKTLAGLFTLLAEEEKKIRQNPAARSTDLLKKVFGQ